MKKRLFIIGYIFWVSAFALLAQTDLLFSNSGMNAAIYNPAVIENNQMINASLLVRKQWIGFPDAPGLEQFSVGTFFDDQNMGIRFSAINLSAGKEITRRLHLAYVYKVYFRPDISLNFGLGAGLYQRQVQFSKLIFEDGTEPLIRPDENYYRPDFEFGLHLNIQNYIVGYAANHLGTNGKDATISRIPLHQHVYAGLRSKIAAGTELYSGLSYHSQGTVRYIQADFQFIFDRFEAGLGWRHNDALIIKAGLHVSESITIHYSYDMGINQFANFNSGSHEFVLRLGFERKSRAYLSPRFLDY